MVAGGGAAGLVIDRVARELGIATVLIPRAAPALAAYGGTVSPLACDFRRTHMTTTNSFDFGGVSAALCSLQDEAQAFLKHGVHEPGTSTLSWYVGARYAHQRWEIEVPLTGPRLVTGADVADLVDRFHEMHERLYAVKDVDQSVECVSWRVRASHTSAITEAWAVAEQVTSEPRSGSRMAFFRGHGWLEATVVGGAALVSRRLLRGPLLIEEPAMTIAVAPGSTLEVGESGDLRLNPRPLAGA
jgi:N-methylhydantoinase A